MVTENIRNEGGDQPASETVTVGAGAAGSAPPAAPIPPAQQEEKHGESRGAGKETVRPEDENKHYVPLNIYEVPQRGLLAGARGARHSPGEQQPVPCKSMDLLLRAGSLRPTHFNIV